MSEEKREELKGKILHLKNLIDYQDGAIGSRMIINKTAGSITLFAVDADEGISEHTAPFDAMVTILDGECEVHISGEPHRLIEGDSIIFPANAPHSLRAITKFKMMLVMIKG